MRALLLLIEVQMPRVGILIDRVQSYFLAVVITSQFRPGFLNIVVRR
jgi:hypothetical protein